MRLSDGSDGKATSPVLLFATLALARASAQSTDDPKERRWNITAECQMVVVPQKAALPLMPELLDEAKVEGAYEKVQQMIAAGEAEFASISFPRMKQCSWVGRRWHYKRSTCHNRAGRGIPLGL